MARSYRFFIPFDQLAKSQIIITPSFDADLFHQMTKVLRMQIGDIVTFMNLNQHQPPFYEYIYRVEKIDKKSITLILATQKENFNELSIEIELVLCLPNSTDKLRFVMEKAVELGVKTVILVTSDHSRLQQKLRSERLLSIVKEAAEQSERGQVPFVRVEGRLRQYLEKIDKKDIMNTFVAMERDGKSNVNDLISHKKPHLISIIIGPEGGFSDDEKLFITSAQFPIISLGERILRYETAAIVMLGIIAVSL